MSSPTTEFELTESIRFFGALVATEGLSQESKDLANKYLHQLLVAMGNSVKQLTAKKAGIKILNDE